MQRIPPAGCAGYGDRLVDLVRNFRAHANIPLGNPELDVAEYIKRVSPANDRFPKRKKVSQERITKTEAKRPLINRITDWMLTLGPKRPRLLIEDEATARADVCAGCSQNVRWQIKCAPCNEDVVSRGQNLRQRPGDEAADKLGACRLHNFFLPAAVYVDRDSLGDAAEQSPAQCWMKTEAHAKEQA